LKATDITVLDVRKLTDVTDYFVICTAGNRRQLRAIQRTLTDRLSGGDLGPCHVEGGEGTSWILVDFYDVVVHLFDPEARAFYDLELLWGDAPTVNWQPTETGR
jgi:ribosome-associated protein